MLGVALDFSSIFARQSGDGKSVGGTKSASV
jgi:hypothetical protein